MLFKLCYNFLIVSLIVNTVYFTRQTNALRSLIVLIGLFAYMGILNSEYVKILDVDIFHSFIGLLGLYVLVSLFYSLETANWPLACGVLFLMEIMDCFNVDLTNLFLQCNITVMWSVYFVFYFLIILIMVSRLSKAIKGKKLLFTLFGLKRHKLKVFWRLIARTPNPHSYITRICEYALVFPMLLLSYMYAWLFPIGGIFLINIVVTNSTIYLWVFILFVVLVLVAVTNPVFQIYCKATYSPLFFKACLWNRPDLICKYCIGLSLTAIGVVGVNHTASAKVSQDLHTNAVVHWRKEHMGWINDQVNHGVKAAGPEPLRPDITDPKYKVNLLKDGLEAAGVAWSKRVPPKFPPKPPVPPVVPPKYPKF